MSEPIHGTCLCGGVNIEVRGADAMGYCHCTRCQRWTGGASFPVAVVPEKNLTITKGQDLVKKYEEKGFGDRFFCGRCGSSLYAAGSDGTLYVGAGMLRDHDLKTQFHIQVAYKAPWDEIGGNAPQFAEWSH